MSKNTSSGGREQSSIGIEWEIATPKFFMHVWINFKGELYQANYARQKCNYRRWNKNYIIILGLFYELIQHETSVGCRFGKQITNTPTLPKAIYERSLWSSQVDGSYKVPCTRQLECRFLPKTLECDWWRDQGTILNILHGDGMVPSFDYTCVALILKKCNPLVVKNF